MHLDSPDALDEPPSNPMDGRFMAIFGNAIKNGHEIPRGTWQKSTTKPLRTTPGYAIVVFSADRPWTPVIVIARSFVGLLLLAPDALACAEHRNHHDLSGTRWREASAPKPASDCGEYEASFNWGRRINPNGSRAELHLVHVDARGRDKAVLAIRLGPTAGGSSSSNSNSSDNSSSAADEDYRNAFFDQLPRMIGLEDAGEGAAGRERIQREGGTGGLAAPRQLTTSRARALEAPGCDQETSTQTS
ncbi:hypothetical protein LX36DRAFT_672515 [Colletotrichum falcatum]|nr:hypothetical protein LX36DRAFT_672515 [Colletotrichum falcatum]